MTWTLHPQLEHDTASLGDLPLSRVLVMNDTNYPWLILVPRKAGITEIIDLDESEQAQLMTEITRAARALREVTVCHKLNVAALGNVVAQLHVHVVARQTHDAAWPRPVWNVGARIAFAPDALRTRLARLRTALRIESEA